MADYDEEGNFNEDEDEPFKKKKKVSNRANNSNNKVTVSARFKGVDPMFVDKLSDLFVDKEFCVILGNETFSKALIEKRVIEFGGEIVQNPGENTFCIITSKLIHKINAYINKDLYDVAKLDWLIKCIDDKKFYPWKPADLWHAKQETKSYFNSLFDPFGDSYEIDSTADSLKDLFDSLTGNQSVAKCANNKVKLREQIALIENKYFDESKLGLFRLDTLYIDLYDTVVNPSKKRLKNNCMDLVELKAKWHGAFIEEKITDDVTHCVLSKK